MVQVMVRKLDFTELEFALCPAATVLDLQTAVSMWLELPVIFIKLVSNGGEFSDPTATVVESIVGWYQVLVVVTRALNVLKDGDVYGDAKLQALTGLAKLGPCVASHTSDLCHPNFIVALCYFYINFGVFCYVVAVLNGFLHILSGSIL